MGENNQEEIPDFFSFAPSDNIDGNDEAYKALSFALDLNNKKVHNIAISGPFGAGKSSLWCSYKEKRLSQKLNDSKYNLPTKNEIVEISLAKLDEKQEIKRDESKVISVNISNSNLNNIKSDKSEKPKIINANNINDNEDDEKIEFEIERAVLQQLLFSVKAENIPCLDTYKISEGSKGIKLLFSLSLFVLFFWWINYFFEEKIFDTFLLYDVGEWRIYFYCIFVVLSAVLSAILGICLYYYLIKLGNIHICSFSFKGLDLSFEQSNGSLINQNYSAIAYYFKKTQKKVVVFEDIDRFSSSQIFVKLRELNTILNKCPEIKDEIKFVYMVKDNIFTKYKRVKFFDIIIPVIPVVSIEACADILLDMKNDKKSRLLLNVNDKLLRIVGHFINDLRILYDCLNEFKIYKHQMKKDFEKIDSEKTDDIDGIDNKIFAMIVYKNYYPQDFEDLHRHKGYLYEICRNYKYGKIEVENGNEYERLDFDHPINENLRDASSNRYKNNGRWIYRQCLKLELKFKYNDSNEDKLNDLTKIEKYGRSSLLFDLIQSGYIDINCEFYVSRKYFGDLTMNDCRYFIIVQSNSDPDFDLSIDKPRLLENKILDYQWSLMSVLNKRMFAYELSVFDEKDANKNKRIKGLISAMCEAEKQNKGFFDLFIKYLDNEIKDYEIKLKDEVFTIDRSNHIFPEMKSVFWDAIYANMDEDTLKTLFGE